MTAPLVLAGWYVDVNYLKKAGIARIQIEIPMDIWESHQDVLGIPPAFDGAKKYVALTRLTEDGFKKWALAATPIAEQSLGPQGPATQDDSGPHPDVGSQSVADSTATKGEETADKPVYMRSQIAWLKCDEPAFQEWIHVQAVDKGQRLVMSMVVSRWDMADKDLKFVLGIESKSELDGPKADAWDRLLTDYDNKHLIR